MVQCATGRFGWWEDIIIALELQTDRCRLHGETKGCSLSLALAFCNTGRRGKAYPMCALSTGAVQNPEETMYHILLSPPSFWSDINLGTEFHGIIQVL